METLNWDHSMINVQDLDQVIQQFEILGVHFNRGGQHKAWGTANAVGYFGINYIELINVYDITKAQGVHRSAAVSVYDAIQDYQKGQQRLNTVAIRSSDLDATHRRLKELGISVGPISKGERLDESGNLIEWRIFFINDEIEELPYPFFIDWQSSDAQRTKQLSQKDLLTNGTLKIKSARFEVDHPQNVAQKWATLLNTTTVAVADHWIISLQDRQFEFYPGKANHLQRLTFVGATSALAGQHLSIGQARLEF